jgi:VWFA-related protein
VLQKDEAQSQSPDAIKTNESRVASLKPSTAAAASRPRRITSEPMKTIVPELTGGGDAVNPIREPVLSAGPSGVQVSSEPGNSHPSTSLDDRKNEEVSEGDVVRIDTNLVTVPVSVLDRNGRFVPNLKRENFSVSENGVEQRIANFEPTEKPFTVALLLDTSGSTFFHLSEIKDAAIAFAKQLRPQDRVLVVTFDERVMLLTEATNDLNVVSEVIQNYAYTGYSTRLYDAIDLVTNQRLNKIPGRKAIVLFTDGVDTASYGATYKSTLRQAEELDALIYPIEYDTTDFVAASQGSNSITVVTTRNGNWFPGRTSSRVVYGPRTSSPIPGTSVAEYRLADQYLHQLADKTGARLYKANDTGQLADAFSKIAEELRCQYSLSYYPSTSAPDGERRQIRVRVNQPDLAVRAKAGYVQRSSRTTP